MTRSLMWHVAQVVSQRCDLQYKTLNQVHTVILHSSSCIQCIEVLKRAKLSLTNRVVRE